MTRSVGVGRRQRPALAGVVTVLAAVTIMCTRVEAQCMGDCLGDGQVTVDELMTMANIALGKMPMAMCEPGDANGDGQIRIEEILAGVNHALTGCPAVSPKLEKAAGVASSTLGALLTLVTAIPVFGPDSSTAGLQGTMAAVVPAGPAGGGAASEPCERGGTISASCGESGGSSTINASFSKCAMFDDVTGLLMTASGRVVIVVAAPGVCSSGVIPDNVRISTKFTGFSAVFTDPYSGAEITRVALSNLTETIDPSGQGCLGPNGTFTLNGSFTVTMPEADVDLSGTANKLALQTTSSGAPCVLQLIANGSVDLKDNSSGRHFSESFANTGATLQEAPDGSLLGSLNGSLNASCVGEMTLTTDEPIALPGGGCAQDGQLSVAFADGTHGRIWFTAGGGLAFDYDDDGTPDRQVMDCSDASVSQCK